MEKNRKLLLETLLQLSPFPPRVVIYVAGGGGALLQNLLTKPGISKIFLEARAPYAVESVLSTVFPHKRPSSNLPLSLCSLDMSQRLAERAAGRCAVLWSVSAVAEALPLKTPPILLGIGCCAALTTTRPRRGEDRIFATTQDASGCSRVSCGVILDKVADRNPRSREAQDKLFELLFLFSVFEFLSQLKVYGDERIAVICGELTREIDSLLTPTEKMFCEKSGPLLNAESYRQHCVSLPAQKLLQGTYSHAVYNAYGRIMLPDFNLTEFFDVLRSSFPGAAAGSKLCVLPGSFNPIHDGHRGMLLHATREDVPDGNEHSKTRTAAFYELSCYNADKGAVSIAELLRRLVQFSEPSSSYRSTGLKSCAPLYSVLITREPLIVNKARLFERPTTFLIGVDTYLRLMDPRYYTPPSTASVLKVLMEFFFKDIRFLVFGRATTTLPKAIVSSILSVCSLTSSEMEPPTYITLPLCKTLLSSLCNLQLAPDDDSPFQDILHQLFNPVPNFRLDLCSSRLRDQQLPNVETT